MKINKYIVMILTVALLVASNSFATELRSNDKFLKEADLRYELVKKYLTVEDEDSDYPIINFDKISAEQNNEPQDVIELGLGVQNLSIEYRTSQVQRISLPVWGNYCGPGYGTKDSTLEPIDTLDQGCKKHDACYKGVGFRKNCRCNKDLVNYISNNLYRMQGRERTYAEIIRTYFNTVGQIGC